LKCEVVFLEYKEDDIDYVQSMIHYYMDTDVEGMVVANETKFSSEEL
jgi:hypothetical protein